MTRWLLVPVLVLGCGGVAGPPERPSCFAVCLATMHAEFASWCPNGSTADKCADRAAIIDRARECEEKCP